ncbi:MAG TPA: carbonate dehydratase [Pyrinomonadaceae bacterium]|nr:carbonate dehydratase [Pyrinomonadaceae bacterium]
MKNLTELIERNRQWAKKITADDPDFFNRLSQQQTPNYLWIGCSDSRVPANEIVGMLPGELFVHRNVANVVVHTDLNCLSVIQYAVEVLKVRHIIVCGHYGCGGIKAALMNSKHGLIDNWLRHVQDVRHEHDELLAAMPNDDERFTRLCELNVIEQVLNVSRTTIVQGAWESGQELSVHGLIYGLENGLLRELDICITCQDELAEKYRNAVASSN